MEGCPVIARIGCFKSGRPWGQGFSSLTPQGAFREVPIDNGLELEGSDYAEGLIELIRDGKKLPDAFVDKLHIIQSA